MQLDIINELVSSLMKDKHSTINNEKAEKYYHGQRTALLAVNLRKRLFPEDTGSDNILTVAAWLHDVMHGSAEDHAVSGAQKAREVLQPHCSAEELDAICDIIRVHDDKRPEMNYSNLVKLVQDADLLDHFGSFDVWRTFTYTTAHDQTIVEAMEFMKTRPPGEHLGQLNFDISKHIFEEKMRFLAQFTERFAVECAGGIWDENSLPE